jgi:asparagine synthase (glutamine-hydrolysing)
MQPVYQAPQARLEWLLGSEIKSVLAHPAVRRAPDWQSIADFLTVRYVPGAATLFENIRKVLPGHWLACDEHGPRDQCYWDVEFGSVEKRREDEYIDGIRTRVQQAVEDRMVADVPVGAVLSGGVDSSVVTGIMSRLSDHTVKTFSVGFDAEGFNELPYARLAAQHFNTEHHEVVVRARDLAWWWPTLTWHRDEPVCESADIGRYLVARVARQHVKVAMTGDGGDEVFAGYPKYVFDHLARYYRMLPVPVRAGIFGPQTRQLSYTMRRTKLAAEALSQPSLERWVAWFGVFSGDQLNKLLAPGLKSSVNLDGTVTFRELLGSHPQRDELSSMLYLDTKFWLPDNVLMSGDKMAMAASVETRQPLLDYRLIEYAASIPSSMKIRGGNMKHLFKRAFRDLLPEPIARRQETGFQAPISAWLRVDLRDIVVELLLSDRARDRGLFNGDVVALLLREHLAGKTDHGLQLFLLASLEMWCRIFIDRESLLRPHADSEALLTFVTAY